MGGSASCSSSDPVGPPATVEQKPVPVPKTESTRRHKHSRRRKKSKKSSSRIEANLHEDSPEEDVKVTPREKELHQQLENERDKHRDVTLQLQNHIDELRVQLFELQRQHEMTQQSLHDVLYETSVQKSLEKLEAETPETIHDTGKQMWKHMRRLSKQSGIAMPMDLGGEYTDFAHSALMSPSSSVSELENVDWSSARNLIREDSRDEWDDNQIERQAAEIEAAISNFAQNGGQSQTESELAEMEIEAVRQNLREWEFENENRKDVRTLLVTLDRVTLGRIQWKSVDESDLLSDEQLGKVYRKAIRAFHPDEVNELQGFTWRESMVGEGVFFALTSAWYVYQNLQG